MDEAVNCKQYSGSIPEEAWKAAKPLIEEAAAYAHKEFVAEDVLKSILAGTQQLWAVYSDMELKFVWVTQIMKQSDRTVCIVFAAAGEMIYGWEFWPWMSQWMIGNGIDEAEVYCRPSMARLLRRHGLNTLYEVLSIKPEGAKL